MDVIRVNNQIITVGGKAISINRTIDRSIAPLHNLVKTIGIENFTDKPIYAKSPMPYDEKKYNAWPFIANANGTLVCVYARASGALVTEERTVYAKCSYDGVAWSDEYPIIENVNSLGVVTAIGNDSDGNIILWLRNGGIGLQNKHELYRSVDNGMTFTKVSEISSPSSDVVIEFMSSIIDVPNVGLMSFFNTNETENNTWGIATSSDNGLTWEVTSVESGLTRYACPAEIAALYLGDGKILAMGKRKELSEDQYIAIQLQSDDYGETWTRADTNILDTSSNKHALLLDGTNIYNLYVNYSEGRSLKLRTNTIESVWDNPTGWNSSTTIHSISATNGGSVDALLFDSQKIAVEYAGTATETSIISTIVDGSVI